MAKHFVVVNVMLYISRFYLNKKLKTFYFE